MRWEGRLATVSESNSSEHWTVKSKRHKGQQFIVRSIFAKERSEMTLPCIVCMTRLSPQALDDDNLRGALKYVRDEISECLIPEKRGHYITKKGKIKSIKGRADADPRIKWEYRQENSKRIGLRIEITPLPLEVLEQKKEDHH